MRRFTIQIAVIVLAGGVLLATDSALGGVITFRKIADTDTPIPGGTGNFTALDVASSLSSGNVAFLGEGSSGQVGIYIDVGGTLNVLADTSTAIPDGTGSFTSFGTASLDGQDVAFLGDGTDQSGIYARIGGTLGTVADLATSIPGGTGQFTGFGTYPPSIDGGSVVFAGSGSSGQFGIYADTGGSLSIVADTGTAIPGGSGNFVVFDGPSLDGGDVAFRGFGSGQGGIYTRISDVFDVVIDMNTAVPGGTGTFSTLGMASIGGGDVALRAGPSLQDVGVYSNIGGSLDVVADTTTPIPNGTGNFIFQGADPPSIDGEYVAFEGTNATGFEAGIYGLIEDTLIRIVDRNDTLDGKTPSNWGFDAGPEALSGTDVVFRVSFTDGSEGIYVATVPLNVCGNGILEAGETCDDGNTIDDDACYSTCRWRIPAVSEWGLTILALLVILAGTIMLRRRGAVAS